jgi:hypothetical protein
MRNYFMWLYPQLGIILSMFNINGKSENNDWILLDIVKENNKTVAKNTATTISFEPAYYLTYYRFNFYLHSVKKTAHNNPKTNNKP